MIEEYNLFRLVFESSDLVSKFPMSSPSPSRVGRVTSQKNKKNNIRQGSKLSEKNIIGSPIWDS